LIPDSSGFVQKDPMRRFWIGILAIFVGVAAVRLISALLPAPDHSGDHPAVGRYLPELQLQGLGEGTSPLDLDDLQGRVVLLNFWGTWCGPCIQEVPHMADLYKRFRDGEGFQLITVSCGAGGDDSDLAGLADKTSEFLEARRLELPTYADRGGVTRRAIMMALDSDLGYPTTLLLDEDSSIRAVWEGFDSPFPRQMSDRIEALLADRDAANTASSGDNKVTSRP